MNGLQLLLERAVSHSFSSTDDQCRTWPAFLPKEFTACWKEGIMAPCWSQGSRSSVVIPHPAMLPAHALQGNASCPSSSGSFSFHPSAFQLCLKSPTSHCTVRETSLLSGKRFECKPPFLGKTPLSRQLKQLQAAWDFCVHVGSTCWASCFSLGFWKVRMAVYWISKHTDHTALLAH